MLFRSEKDPGEDFESDEEVHDDKAEKERIAKLREDEVMQKITTERIKKEAKEKEDRLQRHIANVEKRSQSNKKK